MTLEELEHIIRASADLTNQYEFVILGSQSILGSVPRPEAVFTVSAEADIYPMQAPELAEAIDGAIGEGSQFEPRSVAGQRSFATRGTPSPRSDPQSSLASTNL